MLSCMCLTDQEPAARSFLSPSTTISPIPPISPFHQFLADHMAFDLSLHESITALVFLLVCGKGVLKLATQFRRIASETDQEDIELGDMAGAGGNAAAGGNADAGGSADAGGNA